MFGSLLRTLVILLVVLLSPLHAAELKIMSWNIQGMDIFDGQGIERVPVQLQRERGIAAVIKRVAPDVLLMQKAPSLVELRYFVQANTLPYQVAHVRQQRGNRSYADGMAVLVKEELALEPVRLETPPVPGSRRAARTGISIGACGDCWLPGSRA